MKRLALCLLILSAALRPAHAQIPAKNINMVSGKDFPGGDPWLQKQNEPSIAVSTRNPCHLLAGANDYRAVNVPGLPDDQEVGDAWVGLFKSTDCGQTWWSTLVPGFPQEPQGSVGQQSPAYGFSTAADPTVRAGTNGLFYYSFIAFNRGSNNGRYVIARFVDNNNKEAGDPIQYLGTTAVDTGSSGQFLDKPYIAVDPLPNGGTCTVNGQTVPDRYVYAIWSVFVGSDNNIRTKVHFARLSKCGTVVDKTQKLSEGFPINQGATLAVSPSNGDVYAVWRQFETSLVSHDLLFAKSVDRGVTFTKASVVPSLAAYAPFDQRTSSTTFRTNAYPVATADPGGRIYVAWSVFGLPGVVAGDARVALTTTTDGITWSPAYAIDNPNIRGHQFMPSLTFSAGRLQALYYDSREDLANHFDRHLYPNGVVSTIDEALFDTTQAKPKRHTIDVRAAQAPPGAAPAFTAYDVTPSGKVSEYLTGVKTGQTVSQQLQWNTPNKRLYAGGTKPFMGDYIDVAGLDFVPVQTPSGQQWVPNATQFGAPALTPVFHATWTDNRDARTPPASASPDYVPPGLATCSAGVTNAQTGSRNANVYTAKILPELFVAVLGNAKPLTTTSGAGTQSVQRAFPVLVRNNTGVTHTYRLSFGIVPNGTTASFAAASPVPFVDVEVPRRSSATRTAYITSNTKYVPVQVTVTDVASAATTAAVILNPEVENPEVENPEVENPEVENLNIQNVEYHNPEVENSAIVTSIANPEVENPEVENPEVENPEVENPEVENPEVENPEVENPEVENPEVENPEVENAAFTDVTFTVKNGGNTTSGYQIKASAGTAPAGLKYQLIGARVYKTPTSVNCQLVQAGQNQVAFNITGLTSQDLSPDIALPAPTDQSFKNATAVLAPDEELRVTLRVFDDNTTIGPVFDPTSVVVTIGAQAPNTGQTVPVVVSAGTPDLIVSSGTPTLSAATVAPGGAVTLSPWTVKNQGTTIANSPTGSFANGFYLSSDAVITPADTLLGSNSNTNSVLPAGGEFNWGGPTLTIPASTPPGSYFIGILVDTADQVNETTETNNFVSAPITVALPAPDLIVSSGTPTAPSGVVPGGTVTLSPWTIANQGTGASNSPSGSIRNGFYLSTDPVITAQDTFLDANVNTNGVLPAGGSFNWGGPTLTIPANTAPGAYYIGILVDDLNQASESNEANNYVSVPLTVGAPLIACAGTGGDFIDRGFYVASYPGSTLGSIDMLFSANVAGTYTLSLTARKDTYDGALIGTSTATVALSANNTQHFPAAFYFGGPGVTPNTTVTFALGFVSGPPGGQGNVYYAVLDDANCPVTQTNGTTPPLDTFRRQGVGVKIYGAP